MDDWNEMSRGAERQFHRGYEMGRKAGLIEAAELLEERQARSRNPTPWKTCAIVIRNRIAEVNRS